MMKKLSIPPFPSIVRGRAQVPGSKSITNRALVLAYLSPGDVHLKNVLFSEDTLAMVEALHQLGLRILANEEKKQITLTGCAGKPHNQRAKLDVKNAGTVARFLTAALCVSPDGEYWMDGTEAMRARPMKGLLQALIDTGTTTVEYEQRVGHFPFCLRTGTWENRDLTVDAHSSSQILSALLMAACRASHITTLRLAGTTVSRPFVEMTLRMVEAFGGNIYLAEKDHFRIMPGLSGPPQGIYEVEPDATAASYFWALPLATGGQISLPGFPENSLQGDLAFTEILPQLGLQVEKASGTIQTSLSSGDLPSEEQTFDFNAYSDTFLTVAALAPLLPFPVRIQGISHTRHQETDRIHAMASELKKLGQDVEETNDSLRISGSRVRMRERTSNRPMAIETYKDHRVAMSFAILGSHDLHGDGRPWIDILDPDCTEKTFPNFFDELARMRSLSKNDASQ